MPDTLVPTFRRWPALLLVGMLVAIFGTDEASAQRLRLGDDDEWTLVEPETSDPAGMQLRRIRAALADRDWDRTEFLATRWIETHPDHPLLPEAYLVRGDALAGRGDEYEALFDYELIARRYAGSDAFVRSLEREYDIAVQYLEGRRRKLAGLRIAKAADEAEELLIRLQERLPGSRLAERAALTLADHYFRERRMTLAADMYAIFLENHPRSIDTDRARKRLVAANLAAFKGPEFDASGLIDARTRIEELVATRPSIARELDTTGLLVRIDESRATKQLTTARWYLRTRDPIAAERILRRLIDEHPRTAAATEGANLALELMDRLPPSVQRFRPRYESVVGGGRAGPVATPAVSVRPVADGPASRPDAARPTATAPSAAAASPPPATRRRAPRNDGSDFP
ncbi:MAG: outer membrane protein assembly factor BamD [Phycisphaerales bacterium]